MDNNELRTLEEKTKMIVATLDNLEKETKEYQKKNVDIVAAITNLVNISEQVAAASKELSSAATLFGSSDFSKAMKEINKRIDKLNETGVVFTDQSKVIKNIVEDVHTEYNNLSSEIKTINKSIHEFHEIHYEVNADQSKVIKNIVEYVHTGYNNLSSEIKAVNKSIHGFLEMQNTVNETKELLELIATKIDRIDRNTQKGFGKERG